jgi:hypothetical protein
MKAIDKAKASCEKSGHDISHHFVDVNKMVKLGSDEDVRGLLAKSGIKPEELPPEEDIKKLERRVKADGKKLMNGAKKLTWKKNDV